MAYGQDAQIHLPMEFRGGANINMDKLDVLRSTQFHHYKGVNLSA